jgi:hypothetical protein
MKTLASKLAFAAAVAALVPGLAKADDGHDHRPAAHAGHPAPAAAVRPTYPAPAPARAWSEGRGTTWRERELATLRAEIRALEARRAEFHARFGWNPRKVSKFERWYVAERAALDRRWQELAYYAWR